MWVLTYMGNFEGLNLFEPEPGLNLWSDQRFRHQPELNHRSSLGFSKILWELDQPEPYINSFLWYSYMSFLLFPLPFKVEGLRGVWFWKLAEDCKIMPLCHFFNAVLTSTDSWPSEGACTILECHVKSMTIALNSQNGTCREGKWKNLAARFPLKCNYLYHGAVRFFDFSQNKVPLMNYSMYIFHTFLAS